MKATKFSKMNPCVAAEHRGRKGVEMLVGQSLWAKTMRVLFEAWKLLKDTILSFISDEALSRGAAIAFYTVTSIAPVLLIVIAIAGLAFGRDAAQTAIITQLGGLMGRQTAAVLQTALASAAGKSAGVLATIIGIITFRDCLRCIWRNAVRAEYDMEGRTEKHNFVAAHPRPRC
jgi:uncharacterized BrkB/YihY/UPF0761 family membrane protein